jgi:cytochrome P450
MAPSNQVCLKTTDRWRVHRRIVAGAMTPRFLHNVAASATRSSVMDLVDLWKIRLDRAGGQAFDAATDVMGVILDAMAISTFGSSTGMTAAQRAHLRGLPATDAEADKPLAPPLIFDALNTLNDSIHVPAANPFFGGRYLHRLALTLWPPFRRALGQTRAFLQREMQAAHDRLHGATRVEGEPGSGRYISGAAIDLVFERETEAARQENRKPQYFSPVIRDELLGIFVGFDAVGVMAQWGLKLLTRHKNVQDTLRAHLREVFADAREAGRIPEAEEIAATSTQYLDAVIEEVFRCCGSTPAIVRVAMRNVQLKGHAIPKGAQIFMLVGTIPLPHYIKRSEAMGAELTGGFIQPRGPSYTLPPAKGDNRNEKVSVPVPWQNDWDPARLHIFDPDRWLVRDEQGETRFKGTAGPNHIFGGGPRGCFGTLLCCLVITQGLD